MTLHTFYLIEKAEKTNDLKSIKTVQKTGLKRSLVLNLRFEFFLFLCEGEKRDASTGAVAARVQATEVC